MSTIAQWYQTLEDQTVQCTLCPHHCILREGKAGICRVRVNKGGILMTEVNGFVSSLHFDPIEKKPLYHFYPGSLILSLGTYGCNLRCEFCQNCGISQTAAYPGLPRKYYTPEQIVQIAVKQPNNIGIAFTYNEPTVWFEYMFEIAKLSKEAGLKTVMVTNGFINQEPLTALLEYMDAFSVDMKAFTEEFYAKVTSSRLEPVKEALKQIHKAGKHLEVVNLLIPGLNDDDASFAAMANWIATELGNETVFHISRYFPNYRLTTEATPVSSIARAKLIAEKDLTYVYAGNLHTGSNDTRCEHCKAILIARSSYSISKPGLDEESRCKTCGRYFHNKS
jgi:pyruvate formate lyase activating enzyme